MGSFVHKCKWCRQPFQSKRPHSKFCSVQCRVKESRLSKDFKRFADWVDEETVKANFYVPISDDCIFYLMWFRVKNQDQSFKRFADVWVSKECSDELIRKFKRQKHAFPIRYTSNVSK